MPKRTRRKKRVWRSIDCSDVERALTKKTEEELYGGPASRKTDDQLFFVDTKADHGPLPAAERKAKARAKILYVDKILNPFPHVKPTGNVQPKRKRVFRPEKHQSKRRKLNKIQQPPQQKSDQNTEIFDIWAPPPDPHNKIIEQYPDIEKEYLVPIQTTVKPPKKVTPSFLPSVMIPTEGASYNPPFEAHQALLKEAVTEQLKKRQEIRTIQQQSKAEHRTSWNFEAEVDPIFSQIEDVQNPKPEDDSESDDTIPVHTYNPHIPRKLKAERNKEARKKKVAVELRKKREAKEKRKKLALIEQYQDEIQQTEKAIEERIEKNTTKKILKEQYDTKRLGPEKFQPPEVEVLLTSELPSRLRHVKTTFDPLKDRFTSFQRRNIIETRTLKRYHSRYRTKFTEKFGYKLFTKEQEKEYADL